MPGLPQTAHSIEREVFLGEEVHLESECLRCLPAQGEAALLLRNFDGISEDGQEVFLPQVGVILQDMLLGPASGEQPEQELHRRLF